MEFSHGKTSRIGQVGNAFQIFVSMLLSSQIHDGASPQTVIHPITYYKISENGATEQKLIVYNLADERKKEKERNSVLQKSFRYIRLLPVLHSQLNCK